MKPFKLGAKSWPKAQVTARLDEQSYTVETENGTVYRRNRQHLKKTSESPIQPIQSDPVEDSSTSKPYVPSIPTLTAEPVDKPLGSTSCESSTDQHLRDHSVTGDPGVPEGLRLLMNNHPNLLTLCYSSETDYRLLYYKCFVELGLSIYLVFN